MTLALGVFQVWDDKAASALHKFHVHPTSTYHEPVMPSTLVSLASLIDYMKLMFMMVAWERLSGVIIYFKTREKGKSPFRRKNHPPRNILLMVLCSHLATIKKKTKKQNWRTEMNRNGTATTPRTIL